MARVHRFLIALSLGYVGVLAAVVICWFALLRDDEPQLPGCYWVRLWGMSVKCIQFPGHGFIQDVLNTPIKMLELPLYGAALIMAPRGAWIGLLLLACAALYWTPIAYLLWRLTARKNVVCP